MATKITNEEKGMALMGVALLLFEFIVRIPLFLVLIAYILYTINSGWFGWTVFAILIPFQIIGFAISKMFEKSVKNIQKGKEDVIIESNDRFSNARTINARGSDAS